MNSAPYAPEPFDPEEFPSDELSQMELRIARRADELARTQNYDPAQDFWQQAERELLTAA
jgi:hypothetical protein